MQMPKLEIKSQSGYGDVGVTTIKRDLWTEQGWVAPELAVVKFRNVARFPIRITVPPDAPEFVGPSPTDNPEMFVTSTMLPGLVMFKDFIRITVMNELDEIIRSALITVPITNLIQDGRVRLRPGQTYQVANDMGLFDKTGMPNNPGGDLNYPWRFLFIEADAMNRLPGLNCNHLDVARFYSYQVRWGTEVDIP